MTRLSIAIPVFNEEAVVPELLQRVRAVLTAIPGGPHELLFVDDGSSDRTVQLLDAAAQDDSRIRVIVLSRNFGHQAAFSAALAHVRGDAIVLMDGDLQDAPEAIPEFIERYQQGYDVVYARRVRRKEGLLLRTAYALSYRLIAWSSNITLPLDAGDFALLSRRVVDTVNALPERQRYLRGLRTWVGFRQIGIDVERHERWAGRPKYTLEPAGAARLRRLAGVLGRAAARRGRTRRGRRPALDDLRALRDLRSRRRRALARGLYGAARGLHVPVGHPAVLHGRDRRVRRAASTKKPRGGRRSSSRASSKARVDPAYAQRYRDLATRHWWWRARNDSVRELASRLLGTRRDASILDIGCGDGVLFPFFSRFGDVEGIEPDAAVVSEDSPWRRRIQLRPFDDSFAPGRRYDLIVMLDVLEHIEDPQRALRHVHDLLADDGRLLLTVPAFQVLWTHHDELNRHFRRYTKSGLVSVVQGSGLRVLESWYAFQWLFLAKLVERVRERVAGPSPPEEVPAERLNDALYRACAVEQRVTGRHMPFGSSLLAVIARDDARWK